MFSVMKQMLLATVLIGVSCSGAFAFCSAFEAADGATLIFGQPEEDELILTTSDGGVTVCLVDTANQTAALPRVEMIDCGNDFEAATATTTDLWPEAFTFRGVEYAAVCDGD